MCEIPPHPQLEFATPGQFRDGQKGELLWRLFYGILLTENMGKI